MYDPWQHARHARLVGSGNSGLGERELFSSLGGAVREAVAMRGADPEARETQPSLRVAPTVERRGFFLRYDPALIIEGGLTHSGAALYAALSFLWFADVPPGPKLDELERKTGRRRFEPIEVTAQMLYPYTGLKGDGYSARIRELEKSRPCPFGRCAEPHPLITVRRLGQGRGLVVTRVACGEFRGQSERRRVRVSPLGTTSDQLSLPDAVADENPALPGSEAGTKEFQKAAPAGSGTRQPRLPEPGSDGSQKPAPPGSLYGMEQNVQKKTAAAEAAAAVVQGKHANSGEAYRVIRDLARRHDPEMGESQLQAMLNLFFTALQARGIAQSDAEDVLVCAARSPRVARADRPVAYLRQGILGSPAFLLSQASDARAPEPEIAPGVIEEIRRRAQSQEPADVRWLRDAGVDAAAYRRIAADVADDEQNRSEGLLFPRTDELERRDPERFEREMGRIYSTLPRMGFENPKGFRHVIFFSRCRSLLEAELEAGMIGRPGAGALTGDSD